LILRRKNLRINEFFLISIEFSLKFIEKYNFENWNILLKNKPQLNQPFLKFYFEKPRCGNK